MRHDFTTTTGYTFAANMSAPALPPAVNRRLSRSNSISTSSSVSTVKQIGSKIGHRKSVSQARPTSSESIGQHFSTLDAASQQPATAGSIDRGRSPNLNINRWSHSTTSSAGAIDADFLRQISGNVVPPRPVQPQVPVKAPAIPRSQYSKAPGEPTPAAKSPARSPGRRSRTSSRQTSPNTTRMPYRRQQSNDQISTLASTPELEITNQRSKAPDYFGTTLVDHSRGANKYGQQVEGIALQFTAGSSRQRRPDQSKMGGGLYQAGTNSSHISLQTKPPHGRRRDRSENGSKDTSVGGSMSSIRSDHSRKGGHRSPTQKNMLSQALGKANQAVLLDNAQNIQGAIEAYHEACDILEQVMLRSNDPDDRRKLSAIRETYSTRIAELYDLDNTFDYLNIDKELPDAPLTTNYLDGQDRLSFEDPEDLQPQIVVDSETSTAMEIPLRQESLLPQIFGGENYIEQQPLSSRLKPPPLKPLAGSMDAKYMPPPLSPRRPLSSAQIDDLQTPVNTLRPIDALGSHAANRISTGSVSWLDTAADESHSSISSSQRSSLDLQNNDHELMSAIEADLDAAVDAAYDDDDDYPAESTPRPSEAAQVFQQPEHVILPQPSTEAIRSLATHSSSESVASNTRFDHMTREYLDEEEQEEEELLEMIMSEGYSLENHIQRPGAMSSLPRQSDSSGFSARSSGRTWESSATAATQGTTLSTLTEGPEVPLHEDPGAPKGTEEPVIQMQEADALRRKQSSPLPPLPAVDKANTVGLRDRRMSGQSAAQLKIETFTRRPSVSQQGMPGQAPLLDIPSAGASQGELTRSASNTNISISTLPITPLASIHSTDSTESPVTPALTKILSNSTVGDDEPATAFQDGRPMPPHMHKNTASSNLRPRDLSLATTDLNDLPATPGSALFPTHSRQGTTISGSTPIAANASPNVLNNNTVGGMYIFEQIAEPLSPRSPRTQDILRGEPLPLEPCPESFLLRPFWLMRCLYQTLAHPKGGYVSTKLFIPRDIWRVKGVKIKALDDKVGQCDVLTAALLKLAKVDTLDADAVLEELQQFDLIIDNVRQALAKKLGNDVGLTGNVVAYKNSPAGDEAESTGIKSATSVKSIASSWRKLRSKSSTPAMPQPSTLRKETSSDVGMPSLPMTGSNAVPTSRSYRSQKHAPPTPTGMPHIPAMHANYMSSLARLFDAVQVLDSIARQVEDPGLKATNKTQVGLELSMRGAAEFFSFYIIRFALADIGMLIDKYLKRNGEWVMQ